MTPDFDEIIDRRGTRCNKWDDMQAAYGVSPDDGISMWVADMDFRPPAAVQAALQSLLDHGVYGYPGSNDAYLDAICWWQQNRHGWQIERGDILTVHGLVNGTALGVAAYTRPGDGVCVMSPVYHAFGRVVRASGRELVELPMQIEDGLYRFDTAAWDARMTGMNAPLSCVRRITPAGASGQRTNCGRLRISAPDTIWC